VNLAAQRDAEVVGNLEYDVNLMLAEKAWIAGQLAMDIFDSTLHRRPDDGSTSLTSLFQAAPQVPFPHPERSGRLLQDPLSDDRR